MNLNQVTFFVYNKSYLSIYMYKIYLPFEYFNPTQHCKTKVLNSDALRKQFPAIFS